MRRFVKIIAASLAMLCCLSSSATPGGDGYDVFVPRAKYLGQGDAEKLSAWFADNLEITIMSTTIDSSKNQAKQILKSFFENHTPRSFTINHTASRSNSKYALGYLNAGGELFEVTIFVNACKNTYKIQQLKIDRLR